MELCGVVDLSPSMSLGNTLSLGFVERGPFVHNVVVHGRYHLSAPSQGHRGVYIGLRSFI